MPSVSCGVDRFGWSFSRHWGLGGCRFLWRRPLPSASQLWGRLFSRMNRRGAVHEATPHRSGDGQRRRRRAHHEMGSRKCAKPYQRNEPNGRKLCTSPLYSCARHALPFLCLLPPRPKTVPKSLLLSHFTVPSKLTTTSRLKLAKMGKQKTAKTFRLGL